MTEPLTLPDIHVGDTIGPVEEAFNVDINGAQITAYLRSDLSAAVADAEAVGDAEFDAADANGAVFVAWWSLDTTGLAPGYYWLHVVMDRTGVVGHLHRQRIYLLPD